MHTLSAYILKIYLKEVSLLRFENYKYSQFLQQSKAVSGWEIITHTAKLGERTALHLLTHQRASLSCWDSQ